MGKTKTAFVAEAATLEKSSEEKYKEKKAKQAAKEAEKASGPKGLRPGGEKVHIAGLKGGQRIKMVTEEPLPEQESGRVEEQERAEGPERVVRKTKPRVERIRGKKYQEAKKKVKLGEAYALADAIKLVKETSYSQFDGTFEVHLMVKKTGISASVALPHSYGRAKKIEVASEETIKRLTEGKIEFDVLLATAEMMPKLVPFARLLGPKGLMPNPKNGTLIKSAKDAEKFSGNSLSLRTEREAPLIHTTFGKVSQKDAELKENLEVILKALGGSKQIIKGYLKSTMSPAVRISI